MLNNMHIANNPYNFFWNFFKMIIALIIILLIMYIFLIILKKIFRNKWILKGNDNIIEIISVQPLDQRKRLYLIKISKNYFLIGCSENSMHLITNIPQEDIEMKILK